MFFWGDWISSAFVWLRFSIIAFLLFPLPAFATDLSVAWDESESSVDGYLLFSRSEDGAYDYSSPIWSGVETTAEVEDVEDGIHYFVVRAYLGTAESADSNEVEVIICDSSVFGGSDDLDVDGSDLANVANGDEAFSVECLAAYFGRAQ